MNPNKNNYKYSGWNICMCSNNRLAHIFLELEFNVVEKKKANAILNFTDNWRAAKNYT